MASIAEAFVTPITAEGGREGCLYAVRQLAQRAGVTAEFFRSWTIKFEEKQTVVYLQPGTRKCIRFSTLPAAGWDDVKNGKCPVSRARWMFSPPDSIRQIIPDFVVPFSDEGDGLPLFRPLGEDAITSSHDLPLSTLLTLGRYEEIQGGERDKYGRFDAGSSIATRGHFLDRPIVDELGLAFEQAIKFLLPAWQPRERQLRVKLSHDIDVVGYPFHFRKTIGHILRRRSTSSALRDLWGPLVGLRPTYLELVRVLAQHSLERGLDSAFYWKASPPGPFDSGYDPRHPRIQESIHWLEENGLENGVHPGYHTFGNFDQLEKEVAVLRQCLGATALGGRQHYLRWSPETWIHWERCSLFYDSTLGYADQVGFRAGTCFPYRPWLFSQGREANLIELPLIIMDCVLPYPMGLSPDRSRELVSEYVAKCRLVGGVFTLLWHNASLIEPAYGNVYTEIIDSLAAARRLSWGNTHEELY